MTASQVRRVRALNRDERRLRTQLERQRLNRYDIDAAQAVRVRVKELLETLAFILHDDGFWDVLSSAAAVLEGKEIDALRWFDDEAFGTLLVTSGYSTPPPPPVSDLIADTRRALGAAWQSGVRPELISDARASLAGFLYRARRQLQDNNSTAGESSTAALGRQVGQLARTILPPVAGAAAGALIAPILGSGSVVAGAGVGSVLGKALETTLEKGAETAAAATIDLVRQYPQPRFLADTVRPLTPDQAIAAHLSSAQSILVRLHRLQLHEESANHFNAIVQHLERVQDLAADHLASDVLGGAVTLTLEALSTLRERIFDPISQWRPQPMRDEELVSFAAEALEVGMQARGRADCSSRVYSAGPFTESYLSGEDERLQEMLAELWDTWGRLSKSRDRDVTRDVAAGRNAIENHGDFDHRHGFGFGMD